MFFFQSRVFHVAIKFLREIRQDVLLKVDHVDADLASLGEVEMHAEVVMVLTSADAQVAVLVC